MMDIIKEIDLGVDRKALAKPEAVLIPEIDPAAQEMIVVILHILAMDIGTLINGVDRPGAMEIADGAWFLPGPCAGLAYPRH